MSIQSTLDISNNCLYWAKATEEISGSGYIRPVYHPLPYHCLDVAAVCYCLLRRSTVLLKRISGLLGIAPKSANSLIVFFLALHDIGKFGPSFQAQQPELFLSLQNRGYDSSFRPHHTDIGDAIWRAWGLEIVVRSLLDANPSPLFGEYEWKAFLEPLANAVFGHHGSPPNADTSQRIRIISVFEEQDFQSLESWIDKCLAMFLPHGIGLPLTDDPDALLDKFNYVSWLLAGLTVLCDWLGSNTNYFPFQKPQWSPERYWEEIALPQAERAISSSGVITPGPTRPIKFQVLLPEGASPSPLQDLMHQRPWETGPSLTIVEESTGAGKTEAALILAQRLMASELAESIYFGLPTMATSNAMFGRLAGIYRSLFDPSGAPSLVLAHGARGLNDTFLDSISSTPECAYGVDDANSYCSAWLADSRKKATLAAAGLGTIDQALLSVLGSRHQALRLLGIAKSVLIVDEVHAYDPYIHQLLCSLLRFQAALGGSAILLSASLPSKMRQELVSAFCRSLVASALISENSPYPLVTVASSAGVEEIPVQPRTDTQRRVKIAFVHQQQDVLETLLDAARSGQCACWVRNTVGDAIDAYQRLASLVPAGDLILFHARFAMCDRQRIEQRVLDTFGKGSGPDDRRGKILIGTQVLECSLDIDMDVMVSDLAPIDLLIQRAGRLHRHVRGDRGTPRLIILGPRLDHEPAIDWYSALFPKAAYVYPDHGRLWLTAQTLAHTGAIESPGGIRALVESVYGDDAAENIPTGLLQRSNRAQDKDNADASFGRLNSLVLEAGYADTGFHWLPENRSKTRLGEETSTIRLAKWDGNNLLPWCDSSNRHAWELSQVDLPFRLAASEQQYQGALGQAAIQAKQSMPDQGRWTLLVALEQGTDGQWSGEFIDVAGETVLISYNRVVGLAYQ